MELEINKKKYNLKFGIKFIETIDRLYTQEMNGVQFGMGIELLSSYLSLGRVTAVFNAIKAGTAHLKSKPSDKHIEEYLEDLAMQENDDYETLFDEIEESVEQSPFLKRALKNMENLPT